jgi:uncharacterized protein YndB with AHSA1/START domain
LKPFRFDRCWTFDIGPDVLWAALSRTEDYRRWWPWLAEFSGDGLVSGGRSRCVVRAPVPYTLRFTVTVVELVANERIEAVVDGDLAGVGRPVMERGHDWVVGTGFEQFCRSALRVQEGHDTSHDDRGSGTAHYGT